MGQVPAILKARRALAMHRTQVVLGLGGFTTAPAALAAPAAPVAPAAPTFSTGWAVGLVVLILAPRS